MLQQIRARSGSLVIKIVLSIIGASFVVFGVADIVRIIMATPPVAKMGKLSISFDEFYTSYQRYFAHLMQQEQKVPEAVIANAPNEVLKQLIAAKIIECEPERLGILAPSSVVDNYIKNVPYFQKDGQFDGDQFAQALTRLGTFPQEFMRNINKQLVQQQFLLPLTSGAVLNTPYIDLLMSAVRCKKHFEIVEVPGSAIKASEPSEQKLEAWLKDHSDQYCVPEQRNISVLLVDHEAIVSTITVSERDVNEEMNARQTQAHDVRDVCAFAFDSESDAIDGQKIILTEKSVDKIKKVLPGVGIFSVDMTTLPANIADVITGLSEWESWGPLAAGKQYIVYVVTKITKNPVVAVKREDVVLELKKRKLPAKVEHIKDQIDDALASGKTIGELKSQFPVKVVDVSGISEENCKEKLEGAGLDEKVRDAVMGQVFSLEKNSDSLFADVPNYSVMVRITDVVAKHEPKLAAVKDKVRADWMKHDARNKSFDWASAEFGNVHDDHTLWAPSVARLKLNVKKLAASRLDLLTSQHELSKIFSHSSVERLMLQKKHSVAYMDTTDGRVVVVFVADTSYDASDALNTSKVELQERFRKMIEEQAKTDCVHIVRDSVVESYNVKVNEKVLKMATRRRGD
ncbi:MAG: SurA N-terminal domain-containing protein [Holosporales bacterium]|jgi:peptidyl-prolyl cis-trans isomerase D|nr:SurA N-terminal domain-containing protein [Holosporales bacterium]